MRLRRVVVFCPGTSVSGGPEVLHQLVDCLRSSAVDAAVCYFPFGRSHTTPPAYAHYDVPVVEFADDEFSLFVIPENATSLSRQVSKGKVAIWWLSVDNYFGAKHESRLKDLITRFRSLRLHRTPLWRLKQYSHFVQSEYARRFLARVGMQSAHLTDYLSLSHVGPADTPSLREDIVAYNPLKGRQRTKALIAGNPDIRFIPIRDMTPSQVAALLRRAKLYVDFGHHPGKDRLPREAVMAGCCVITNRRGSAAYWEDVPIPERYKLADEADGYHQAFHDLAVSVFQDFDSHRVDFDDYRSTIRQERSRFESQVRELFLGYVQVGESDSITGTGCYSDEPRESH